MKFINYLKSISGIEIYPLISLLIFVAFFTLLIIYTLKASKQYIQEMKNIPLDNKVHNS
jgi:hypothetical protein